MFGTFRSDTWVFGGDDFAREWFTSLRKFEPPYDGAIIAPLMEALFDEAILRLQGQYGKDIGVTDFDDNGHGSSNSRMWKSWIFALNGRIVTFSYEEVDSYWEKEKAGRGLLTRRYSGIQITVGRKRHGRKKADELMTSLWRRCFTMWHRMKLEELKARAIRERKMLERRTTFSKEHRRFYKI